MIKKEFLRLPISALIPYDNNPRDNDAAVDDVVESMAQCGDLDPIEIDEDNVILSGHTRLKALIRRGVTEADVLRFTGLSEDQKRKYRILANKTGERATWDYIKLMDELQDLDFGGYDFGLDSFDMDSLEPVVSFSGAADKEYFTASFTFPSEMRDKIQQYLRAHKAEITEDIIKAAGND